MFNCKLTLLKNKAYKDGTFPVMLRISKNKKKTYISTGYSCLPKSWDNSASRFKRNFDRHSYANAKISEKLNKAFELADKFHKSEIHSTLKDFKEAFKNDFTFDYTLFTYFEKRIEFMIKADRVGNAKFYDDCYKSIKKFSPARHRFDEWNAEFLEQYETFLRGRGGTNGGIAARMKGIRAVFNHAIKMGFCPKNLYPFDKYEISKLKREVIKKALSQDEIKLIEAFDTNLYPSLLEARNYFIFAYYCRGMNFTDLAQLQKAENIKGNKIVYGRSKTGKPFKIEILPPVQKIIDYYSIFDTKYIFPILRKKDKTPDQIMRRIRSVLRNYNKKLQQIAAILGIDKLITSNYARHSFATNLKFLNVPIQVISELLGHKDLKTTEIYLAGFDSKKMDDVARLLLQ